MAEPSLTTPVRVQTGEPAPFDVFDVLLPPPEAGARPATTGDRYWYQTIAVDLATGKATGGAQAVAVLFAEYGYWTVEDTRWQGIAWWVVSREVPPPSEYSTSDGKTTFTVPTTTGGQARLTWVTPAQPATRIDRGLAVVFNRFPAAAAPIPDDLRTLIVDGLAAVRAESTAIAVSEQNRLDALEKAVLELNVVGRSTGPLDVISGLLSVPGAILKGIFGLPQQLLGTLTPGPERWAQVYAYLKSRTDAPFGYAEPWKQAIIRPYYDGLVKDLEAVGSPWSEAVSKALSAYLQPLILLMRTLESLPPSDGRPSDVSEVAWEHTRFDYQSRNADSQVVLAVLVVNGILYETVVLDLAAEMFSLGQFRGVGQAVQNFIWANNLGQFASEALNPVLQTSSRPLRQRLYNRRALANIPGPSDLVRFELREAFLPGRREQLLAGPPRPIFNEYMAQQGYSSFWADSYWAAHWELPSISQLNEMLQRGVISAETWRQYVTYNDYTPEMIPNLERIQYNPYTRVDARRMYDLGVLDEQSLRQAYADLGYYAPTEADGKGGYKAVKPVNFDPTVHKAEGLVIWTKLETLLPDLRKRYVNGWIDKVQLRRELTLEGLPLSQQETVYQTIVKADTPARLGKEKQLTMSQIMQAAQRGVISETQAILLIRRLGYSEPEATLLLSNRKGIDLDDPRADTLVGERLLMGFQPPSLEVVS